MILVDDEIISRTYYSQRNAIKIMDFVKKNPTEKIIMAIFNGEKMQRKNMEYE